MFSADGALTSEANTGQNDPTDQKIHFEAFNHKSKLR